MAGGSLAERRDAHQSVAAHEKPGRAWLGATPSWGRNWLNQRIPAGAVQWLFSMVEFLRQSLAPRPAAS
jgi:hypothetical protein